MRRRARRTCAFTAAALFSLTAQAQAPGAFQFETIMTLDDMRHFVETNAPPGTSREALRHTFVDQGKATLKTHPTLTGVEKYVYDINLCSYYVWRWNISADFDGGGHALQVYVNGEPVFPKGPQKKTTEDFKAAHPTIYKVTRARPEASKGESQLAYVMFDADSDTHTIEDELAMGGGPSRADPVDMGSMHMYANVDPWRSIFDKDAAARIVDRPGSCKEADDLYARVKAGASH